jgi:hypothetical protein
MKINFDFKFTDLKGEVQGNAIHAGEYLANVLAADDSQKDNAIKFHAWALDLYKRDDLDLDKQDAETLQTFINTVAKVPATIRAQLKDVMNVVLAKDEKKKSAADEKKK